MTGREMPPPAAPAPLPREPQPVPILPPPQPRQIPVSAPLRDSILAKLNTLDAGSAVLSVDGSRTEQVGGEPTTQARLALMWKKDDRWSFAGWLGHTVRPSEKDTEVGFEVRLST